MRTVETLLSIQATLTGLVLIVSLIGHFKQRKDMRELLSRKNHIKL